MSNVKPPKGFRDFLPGDFRDREYLKSVISGTYEKFGYSPIDTPVMESVEVLLGKGGGENEKLMFQVLKRGRKLEDAVSAADWNGLADMGLRYDLTVPLARFYAANRGALPAVFKRYHIAPVWRADRPQFGRFREFVQCDVDVIGSDSMLAEADVICATAECLRRIGFRGMKMHLNCRPLVGMLIRNMGAPENLLAASLRALDKIDRFGIAGAVKEMEEACVPAEVCAAAEKFHESAAAVDNAGRLALIGRVAGKESEKHVRNLGEIIEYVPPLEEFEIEIDPFLVRGMDYYTGPIFEVRAPGAGFSVAGGGRYDGLVGALCGGANVPATGFSIGFERILALMREKEMIPAEWGGLDVVVCAEGEGREREMLALAGGLRAAGLAADAAVVKGAVGKLMQEAEKRGAKLGVILKKSGEVEVRNLATRRSETVAGEKAAEYVAAVLKK